MNILLIDPIDLPFGGAHSMHVYLLMRGLRENGADAFLVIPYGQHREALEKKKNNYGRYNGVPYCILKTRRKGKKLLTFLDKCRSAFYTAHLVYRRNRKKKIDAVILGEMPDLLRDFPLILLCFVLRIPLYPWFVEKMSVSQDYFGLPGWLNRQSQRLTERLLPGLSSGVIVITKLLKEHYGTYLPEDRILISPILVAENKNEEKDHAVSGHPVAAFEGKRVLVYSGSFQEKDGVRFLLDAFSKLQQRYPDLLFVMTGTSKHQPTMETVHRQIKALGLESRVKLTGFVDSSALYAYTNRANILFVCRTGSPFSHYGFPWKLGEYCMTGRPVICTNVSDIGHYFTDERDLFLVEPDNAKAIAEKAAYILDNYPLALQVAQSGRETAIRNFNYFDQSAEIIRFLTKNNPKQSRRKQEVRFSINRMPVDVWAD